MAGDHDTIIPVLRAQGGGQERIVRMCEGDIPDLWHIAESFRERAENARAEGDTARADVYLKARDKILDTWYLAHDLFRQLRDGPPGPRAANG